MTTTEVIHDLGHAAYNMTYPAFCESLGLTDDSYARGKYAQLKLLARAMDPFSDSTLAVLTEAYRARLVALGL